MKIFKKIIQKRLAVCTKKILEKYDPKVIAITGSVGKTSTKKAIAEVLKGEKKVRASRGNFNTEIGLPLAVINAENPGRNIFGWIDVFFRAGKMIRKFDEKFPEYLILEMGADHPGDIDYLTKIAKPFVSIVTAVSESHMEFFGSLEDICKEKSVLVERTDHSGLSILNADDNLVLSMKDQSSAQVMTFGFSEGSNIKASDFTFEYDQEGNFVGSKFKIEYKGKVHEAKAKNIIAISQVYVFLSGLAVGVFLGIDIEKCIEKLRNMKPENGRMNFVAGIKRTTILDDSYNSSPRATFNALETLGAMRVKGRKIAVLGDMLELGSFTEKAHQMVGEKIAKVGGIDSLVLVGERSQDIAKGAEQAGFETVNIFHFEETETAGKFVQERIKENDLILVKASRGMHFEKITKELMAEPLRAKELLIGF